MSSATIVSLRLIVLISNIICLHQTTAVSQCELSSAIHLQSVTYTHSIIVRVQPIVSSEADWPSDAPAHLLLPLRKVLVREVIKYPLGGSGGREQIKMNDLIIIRIKDDQQEDFFDDACWQLLRVPTVDAILFLNQTSIDEFDLYHPPVESTFRVRQNIDAVLHHETYPPQVLIKTRLDLAIRSREYSLQCYSRGNPLPRLLWSKEIDSNQTLEYFPSAKQCKTPCRIYTTQNRYQSTLFFQPLILDDIGTYVCHAENPMNRTSTSVYLDIDRSITNVTCANLQFCHHRGQCILVDQHLKCLCDNRYFGDHCETNYDDIVKKQDNAILLFKSRFLAGCILVLIGCLLLLIALLSWFLARNNRRQQQRNKVKQPSATTKPLIPVTKEKPLPAPSNGRLPPPRSIEPIVKPSSPPSPTPPTLAAGTIIRLSHSPIKGERSATPPESQKRNRPAVTLTRESSTATDEDDEAGYNIFLRHHHPTLPPVPHETDEEYEERFSLQMNKSEELGLGYLTNGFPPPHLPSTDNRPILYPYEHRTGLIKPLNIGADVPQRYTKYVSSYSKFVLPRPVQSTTDYPLR